MLDFENRKHIKFQFNWPISFRSTNFLIHLNICKFQNVLRALGFEVKHSIILCGSFRTYNNFKYGFHSFTHALLQFNLSFTGAFTRVMPPGLTETRPVGRGN